MLELRKTALAGAIVLLAGCGDGAWTDLWSRPERRAQVHFDAGRFAEAAEEFTDPLRRGVALYRAGEFEEAAAVLGRDSSAEGAFNRGDALILLGEYTEAMKSFDRALALRPGWREAEENRELARLREELRNPEVEDVGGTGGQLGADEIVFDDQPRKGGGDPETVEVDQGAPLSDEELRALWLRKVDTRPADFLRAKFAYQLARSEK